MSMLEKMARAMCVAEGANWDACSAMETLGGNEPADEREHYFDLARAALQAIRELPLGVQKSIFDDRDGFVHELDIPKVWTFGIDAILQGGE